VDILSNTDETRLADVRAAIDKELEKRERGEYCCKFYLAEKFSLERNILRGHQNV